MKEKDLEKNSVDELKVMLRAFKPRRKALRDEAMTIHNVYERKVIERGVKNEVANLSPAKKEAYRKELGV